MSKLNSIWTPKAFRPLARQNETHENHPSHLVTKTFEERASDKKEQKVTMLSASF